MRNYLRLFLSVISIASMIIAIGWLGYQRLDKHEKPHPGKERSPAVPVEIAPITHGSIALTRLFHGTLQARAEFVIAPKISGRIERLWPELADSVSLGEVVARLDNAEYQQAVTQAEADVSVARANLAEAQSLLKIAERELQRNDQLQARGVGSAAQRDNAQAAQLASSAHVQVTQAQLTRAQAQLAQARIRLGYTEVRAEWQEGAAQRVVAERYVDVGETVTAHTPLLRIVELDPITVVFHLTESEYPTLRPKMPVSLSTDAYPKQQFAATIERIAPVFSETTRQARVEASVANPDGLLKPGMFARVNVVLKTVDDAIIVPQQALTRRDGNQGVFVVNQAHNSVSWRPVTVGIVQGQQAQVSGLEPNGEVVIMGQQWLKDGAAILLPEPPVVSLDKS